MNPWRAGLRIVHIGQILARYRLDELIELIPALRVFRFLRLVLPKPRADIAELSLGARLRLALAALGPIFVKFGQILATRRDLIPPDIAEELAQLQDRVAPFPGEQARHAIERALKQTITQAFAEFDSTPLASASIAQVHAAKMHSGESVVVKVLRPGIGKRIEADIALLRALGAMAHHFGPNPEKVQPREIVAEIERTLRDELDLQREGANATSLRRNFENSPDLLVPRVYWSHSNEDILTLERVHGIRSDDVAAIDAAGINRAELAAKGVRVFYTQVFRDNLFHADAHAGNIWVDAERADDPRFIALDFGIVGQLSRSDQHYIAENFMAMFNHNYRRIAELHIQAGWMPDTIRIDELESAVRTVCEPYFTRPLAEISLGEVLMKLFSMARRYELTLQPQLILLQKTLLNIEGLGRLLDPKLDIWAVAKPVLEEILKQRYSLKTLQAEFRERAPELFDRAPELPRLIFDYLQQAAEGKTKINMRSTDLARLAEVSVQGQRRTVYAILGAAMWIVAAVLLGLKAGGPAWFGIPSAVWIAGLGGIGAFYSAWPRSKS